METADELRTLMGLAESNGLHSAAEWLRARLPAPTPPPVRPWDSRRPQSGRWVGRQNLPPPEPWHRTVPPWEDEPCVKPESGL